MQTPNGRAEIKAMFGDPANADGTANAAWEDANIRKVAPPAGWILYYQDDNALTKTSGIRMHRLLADSFVAVLTDIWAFALQSLHARLLTGYGFASFWGSSAIQDLPEGKEWAAFASHSHNGYLDTALGMGLPGLALLIGAIVIKPLRDFQAADQGGNGGPLATLFLRIWLFGLYLSSMESFFLDRAEPMWFTFLVAVFGLHYMARFRTRA